MTNWNIIIRNKWGYGEVTYEEIKCPLSKALIKYNEIVCELKNRHEPMVGTVLLREGKYKDRMKHRPIAKAFVCNHGRKYGLRVEE